MKCHRCSGIMANEKFYGPGQPFWGWRCVHCGEILDPIILENRDHGKEVAMMQNQGIQVGKKGRR